MSTTHTPGPWIVKKTSMSCFVDARIGGGMLQEVAWCGQTAEPEQMDANARLIAAAPDLLEALVAVVSVADRATVEFNMARAAIAKATGAA